MAKCGGVGAERSADEHIQALCDKVKNDVEVKVGQKYETFKAVTVASQCVAGTNYFIKVHVGNEDYLHLRVFKPLACDGTEPSLHSVQTTKVKGDPLKHF